MPKWTITGKGAPSPSTEKCTLKPENSHKYSQTLTMLMVINITVNLVDTKGNWFHSPLGHDGPFVGVSKLLPFLLLHRVKDAEFRFLNDVFVMLQKMHQYLQQILMILIFFKQEISYVHTRIIGSNSFPLSGSWRENLGKMW